MTRTIREPEIKRVASGYQNYEVHVDGRHVGTVTKTGTHLDHYPWDWMLLDGMEPHVQKNGYKWKSTGVAETLKSGVHQVAAAAGAYSWMENR